MIDLEEPMKDVRTGEFTGLVVSGSTVVNGAVKGVTVEAGAGLTVNGQVEGIVEIGDDAVLLVYGLFDPEEVQSDGIVMAAGMFNVPRSEWSNIGRFALSPGTLIERHLVLNEDGSESEVTSGSPTFNIDGSVWCAWVEVENRFMTSDELSAAVRDEN